jgi:O-methyltransferase
VISQDLYLDLFKKCLTGYLYPESSHVEIYALPGLHPRAIVRRIVVKLLNSKGYKIHKVMPFDPKARETGIDWPSLCYSMVGLKRLDNLQACVETAIREEVPGDLIETGVWRGGACILMRAILKVHNVTDRLVWVADSFEGLPSPSHESDMDYDLSRHPYLAVSLEEVRENFQRFGLLDEQTSFLKGWFKDTLPIAPIDRLAVLRLDGDLYESTMDVLSTLYHKVSAGGFIIVDDYHQFPNCKLAVEDFRSRMDIRDSIEEIDGSGVFWRKSA